jgi:hypothetical protein
MMGAPGGCEAIGTPNVTLYPSATSLHAGPCLRPCSARLDEPGPVVDAGLCALDRGVPAAIPGLRNQTIAFLPRIAPRRLITSISGRLLTPKAAQ